MNKPAEFLTKAHAQVASKYIYGPQVGNAEAVGKNIKVYWNDGTTSLAPSWWFHKMIERE